MKGKAKPASEHELTGLIKAALRDSGLKEGPGLFKALNAYTKRYRITGIKNQKVKIYLVKVAMRLAKTDKPMYVSKSEAKKIGLHDVRAAVQRVHRPTDLDDSCVDASREIMSLEQKRKRGSPGILSPRLGRFLDRYK